jgi:hypothetical protein
VPADRDEVGLVRSIVVKERSSAKRKEMWRTIQIKVDVMRPMQLVLDMKVRWSSTYVMLHRAESLKEVTAAAYCNKLPFADSLGQCADRFIDELVWEEKKDKVKREKIRALMLTDEEWDRVGVFLSLLSVCTPPFHTPLVLDLL